MTPGPGDFSCAHRPGVIAVLPDDSRRAHEPLLDVWITPGSGAGSLPDIRRVRSVRALVHMGSSTVDCVRPRPAALLPITAAVACAGMLGAEVVGKPTPARRSVGG